MRQETYAVNLHTPVVWYTETGYHMGFGTFPGTLGDNLVPGRTHSSPVGLVHSVGSTQDCSATLDYTMTYTLRWYPFLGP